MHPSLEKQAHLSNEDCDSRIFEVETVVELLRRQHPTEVGC
jgi:hypothetical protein